MHPGLLVQTSKGWLYDGRPWEDWADAIACRLADESPYDRDDKAILEPVLAAVLRASPEEGCKLVGTGVIEEGYFDDE